MGVRQITPIPGSCAKRWLAALVVGSVGVMVGCDDDSSESNIDPIPSDNSVVNSGLPTTDGSTITTPAPNPNAGGGAGSGTAP